MQTKKDKGVFNTFFSVLLMVVALLWISFVIYHENNNLSLDFSQFKWSGFYYMIFFGSLASFTNAVIFNTILKVNLKKNIHFFYSSSLLFVGQMVRHLPGRFWGLVYQINAAREQISPLEMVKINYDYMVISAGLTVVIPTSVILYSVKGPIGVSFFGVSIFFGGFLLKKNVHILVIQKIIHIFPLQKIQLMQNIHPINSYSLGHIISIFFWGGLGWIFYFIGWRFLGLTFEPFSYSNLYLLCAIYSIAWLIGFLSILTPSGIGVREMVFIILTPDLEPTYAAIIAVIVRLWLLVNDMILSILFLMINLIQKGVKYE